MNRFGCVLLCLLLWPAGPVRAETVTLATNLSEGEAGGEATGGSVTHVRCIFKRLGHSPSIRHMPWRRARQAVSTGRVDGFFTAIPMPPADRYATLSAPLVLENWYWYGRPPDETSAPASRLGAVLGSHQAAWLEQQGYPVALKVASHSQLLKLLLSGRIDAFVADRDRVESAAEQLGVDPARHRARFLRYMPLGVYFGQGFLARRPDFLPRFNRAIFGCASDGFAISTAEREEIADWLQPLTDRWLAAPGVRRALRERNRAFENMTGERRDELDSRWRKAFRAGERRQVQSLVDTALSGRVLSLATESGAPITEVILTGRRGLNLAISRMTSDYWQGDESKFRRARDLAPGQLHFDPVRYDESTRRFQVHVSRPVYDPVTGDWLGMLIVGIDVEKALAWSALGES